MKLDDFINSLTTIWTKTPEVHIYEITLVSILRTIWISPYTITKVDFGTFKRLTKPKKEGVHSPFFYGKLSDKNYLAIVENTGDEYFGIKLIRKVLDHMNAFQHTPSLELTQTIIEECITGKWPEALFKAVSYSQSKGVVLTSANWIEIISYYRYCLDYFQTGLDCLKLAFEKNEPEWNLIEHYILKYLKHKMIDEAEDLFTKAREALEKKLKNSEDKSLKVSNLIIKYLKTLYPFNLQAYGLFNLINLAKTETLTEDSIEAGFKLFEEVKDTSNAVNFYKAVINKDGFFYSPRFIAAALRMCSQLGPKAIQIVDSLKDLILSNKDLGTPFSLNMIIVSYSNGDDWGKLTDFLNKAIKSQMTFNKYTLPTIQKMLERCLQPNQKNKILDLARKIAL